MIYRLLVAWYRKLFYEHVLFHSLITRYVTRLEISLYLDYDIRRPIVWVFKAHTIRLPFSPYSFKLKYDILFLEGAVGCVSMRWLCFLIQVVGGVANSFENEGENK